MKDESEQVGRMMLHTSEPMNKVDGQSKISISIRQQATAELGQLHGWPSMR